MKAKIKNSHVIITSVLLMIFSISFFSCSSEDDFGEMEEMEYTMASKKMTRAGEYSRPLLGSFTEKITFYRLPNDGDGRDNISDENFGNINMEPYDQYDCALNVSFDLYADSIGYDIHVTKVEECVSSKVKYIGGERLNTIYELYFETNYTGYTGKGHITLQTYE